MGSHSFLQKIFPTQGWNPGLLCCRQSLYHLSHEGSLGPHSLSILCIVCVHVNPNLPIHPSPFFLPSNSKFFLTSVTLFLFCKQVHLYQFFLDFTCQWYHMILVFVWLTSLGKTISRSLHGTASDILSSFFKAEWYSIVYMYYIFFIHPSADGQLYYLHVLAVVNSAVVNIWKHASKARIFICFLLTVSLVPRTVPDSWLVLSKDFLNEAISVVFNVSLKTMTIVQQFWGYL